MADVEKPSLESFEQKEDQNDLDVEDQIGDPTKPLSEVQEKVYWFTIVNSQNGMEYGICKAVKQTDHQVTCFNRNHVGTKVDEQEYKWSPMMSVVDQR